jgi:ribosomal protein S12 methylthiotransferase accessory factor YcaO
METVERWSGTTEQVMRRSFLGGEGPHWSEFSPYTAEEVAATDALRRGWPDYRVTGVGLRTRRRIDVPAESVFPWWRSFFATPTPLPEGEGGGIAAGFSDDASATLRRALNEMLERDALMLSWRVPRWPARPLPQDLLPPEIRNWLREQGLQVHLYDVGDPLLVSVIMALLSRDGEQVTIGASCNPSLPQAALKAVLEAIMLRDSAQHLDSVTQTLTPDTISDSYEHVVWAWRHGRQVLDWYARETTPGAPSPKAKNVLAACEEVFGQEPLMVDLTHPELAREGFLIVRVLQAGSFKKEYRHDARYRGGSRLARLGLRPEDLNPLPHPIG